MEDRAARWGIEREYTDAGGTHRTVSPEAVAAVLEAMGADADAPPPSPIWLGRPGERLQAPATVILEDGSDLGELSALPGETPYGYHRLVEADGAEGLLIVAPERCPLPAERSWGWAAQLYAVRSAASWGIGDLADLAELGRWSRHLGAGFLLLNPFHAATPTFPQEASPYFPSSRRFRSPLLLRIEELPGAEALGERLAPLAAAGRALNERRLIDRDAVLRLKLDALELLFAARPPGAEPAFDAWRAERGAALEEWALFCVAAERHGAHWTSWPPPLRDREPAALAACAAEDAERITFHAWLQWLIERQLAAAGEEIGLVGDLAVGFDPQGCDAWSWQELLARGASIGAPPDPFNQAGQDWALPPFVPHRLRAAGYTPLIETLRASLRHAAGLRVDHVMGLFRLWWVPAGAGPAEGAYVRYPADELLAVLTLEAQRAEAVIVGEDLGTVEPGVRSALARRAILSYRVMLFEGIETDRYPELALATLTTHDLPTVAGLWSGADLEQQAAAGLTPNVEGNRRLAELLAGTAPTASAAARAPGPVVDERRDAIIRAAHRRLAASPARLVAATLEDALRVAERPNLPGTTSEQAPNWSRALPVPLEEIQRDPFVEELAEELQR
jgi:4-alpha-glucanotransferase